MIPTAKSPPFSFEHTINFNRVPNCDIQALANKICSVCRESLINGLPIVAHPDLSHPFHEICLIRNIEEANPSCPTCDTSIEFIDGFTVRVNKAAYRTYEIAQRIREAWK